MIFDLLLYGMAIALTLSFVGSTRPARPIHHTLDTLHAIGEALPAEVFATDADLHINVDLPDYDELSLSYEEKDVIGVRWDDYADLLSIASPRAIDTRWLGTLGTHALRTLGSLEGITGARRWTKAIALSTLQAHYALV